MSLVAPCEISPTSCQKEARKKGVNLPCAHFPNDCIPYIDFGGDPLDPFVKRSMHNDCPISIFVRDERDPVNQEYWEIIRD